VNSTAAARAKKAKAAKKDYQAAVAGAVSKLASLPSREAVVSAISELLTGEFDAVRSELWLSGDSGAAPFLAAAAGTPAGGRAAKPAAAPALIAEALRGRKHLENVALAKLGSAQQAALAKTGLAFVWAYPLVSGDKVAGVLAGYTRRRADADLLRHWSTFAQVAAIALEQARAVEDSGKVITQLSLLFEATRLLNSTLDLAELLELILKIARHEVQADRGTVFLVDSKHKELWSIVASGLDHQEIRLPFGLGVAGKVAVSGETINTADAYGLEFFESSFDQKFGYRTRSLLCLPIRHHTGEIVGVIQLLNKTTAPQFTAEDEDFLMKLSGHMAMALENARLHREALEKQRMERELEMARAIQRSLLPEAPPVVPGYELAVSNEPCFEVGGDYYDFLNLGPQTLLLVIADVEGKGVSSAMVMSNLQATLRALVMHLHSLEVLTLSLNEMIYNDTKSEKFLSIFLGLVDIRRNGLHYINAGHVPPILVSGETGAYRLLEEGGTVVGLFPDSEYTRGGAKLQPGDVLVGCTDGIMEACDTCEEEYGVDRLAACVARNRTKSAQAIVDAVLDEVNFFSVGGVHKDDKVLMVLKVTKEGVTPAAGKAN
jgi:sigma-B regulation protein RsbU (phosphoserine phosphatase)